LSLLELSCALGDNVNTRPLIDEKVSPEGIALHITCIHASEMFWRQLKFAEFDVSEMSMASLMVATAKGQTEWVGIPVFTTRRFFHTGVYVRNDRGIESPADLKGKTVGVPEYQQTAAVWTRGVLRDDFGVDPRSMKWFMERNPEQSHGGSTGFTPPPGIDLQYVPRDKNLGQMVIDGELDALIHHVPATNLVDRSHVDPLKGGKVRLLFDPVAESHRYYAKHGIYPINHGAVVRRSIAEAHPWVVLNLFNAFAKAKDLVGRERTELLAPYVDTGVLDARARAATATDLLPYGIKGPKAVLETISRYLHEDGLTSRRIALDEVFAKSTLDL
jgi:4,5-dihydroxyphthalate decarboxylase